MRRPVVPGWAEEQAPTPFCIISIWNINLKQSEFEVLIGTKLAEIEKWSHLLLIQKYSS